MCGISGMQRITDLITKLAEINSIFDAGDGTKSIL
jgi:hypothetical protein